MATSAKTTRKPTISEVVHFVPGEINQPALGLCRPGIIAGVQHNLPQDDGSFQDVERLMTVNLAWFDGIGSGKSVVGIEYSAQGHKRTWHWADECPLEA